MTVVDDTLLGIGQVARASGLTVSALRFYAGTSVLLPALVDPATGYRWYQPDQVRTARLIAQLRRVAMPLPDIRQILAADGDAAEIDGVIDRHLRRLEAGLDDAKRVLSTVQHLIADQEEHMPTTTTVPTEALAGAARAVGHAVGHDPDHPMLRGVLVEVDADEQAVRLVTTDRFRLSVATIRDCKVSGPSVSILAPPSLLDTVTAVAGRDVAVTVDAGTVTLNGERIAALDFEFPPYTRVLRTSGAHTASVATEEFRRAVEEAATRSVDGASVVSLAVSASGDVSLTDDPDAAVRLVVNREFLLQAVLSMNDAQLVLDLDGPLAPLALRSGSDGGGSTLAMVMPVRES